MPCSSFRATDRIDGSCEDNRGSTDRLPFQLHIDVVEALIEGLVHQGPTNATQTASASKQAHQRHLCQRGSKFSFVAQLHKHGILAVHEVRSLLLHASYSKRQNAAGVTAWT